MKVALHGNVSGDVCPVLMELAESGFFMNLEVLSSNESRSLCLGAANLVLNRFQGLARRTAPEDPPLALLFADLAGDMERSLLEIQRLEGQNPLRGAGEEMGQTAARGFLPSLSKTGGEAHLNRESGFYLMECILEDLAGFYGALVRQTTDEKSREFILRSKHTVNGRLDFLRHVVLEEKDVVSSLGHPVPGLP